MRNRYTFWKARQADFEKYSMVYRDLAGNWDAPGCNWRLNYGFTTEGISRPPQPIVDIFMDLARNSAVGIEGARAAVASGPRVAEDADPWRRWLDHMRLSEWEFNQNVSPTPCTEIEWDAGVRDGKPLLLVRREHKYSTGDEWKKVYWRTKGGNCGAFRRENSKPKAAMTCAIFTIGSKMARSRTSSALPRGIANIFRHL